MEEAQTTHAYVGAFMDELARSGVRHICFSPGSRSTPLVLLAAENEEIKLWVHIDERSAGFFALGLAKELGEPVGLLCSSGTAAANFYPAIIEAYYDRVPLVVLTADRPHELRDSGAPQTIDQIRLYGEHVKWFSEMAIPDSDDKTLRYVRSVASRAVDAARKAPAGPVHLNFPFREPLVPQAPTEKTAPVSLGRSGAKPYTSVLDGERHLDQEQIDSLLDEIQGWRRGLIVCGPQRDPNLASHVVELADMLGYPILADPLSGVRYGWHDPKWIIDSYDAFLRDTTFVEANAPDVVIRFGAMPTSKALLLYLERHPACRQIVIDEGAGWREPTRMAEKLVHADARSVCEALLAGLPEDLTHADRSWGNAWRLTNERTKLAITEKVNSFNVLFEGRLFAELGRILPRRTTLYVGNSMPVRDLDTFLFGREDPLLCYANRGANGIDGVVSSALGASAGTKRPVVLVIGDLSFYHDLNGLLAAKQHGLDLTIIVVNNDGGGIFSFLPQAKIEKHFEPLYGTPHGLDFAPVVAMYGGTYNRVATWESFHHAVETGIERGGLNVVEVPTVRKTNYSMHQAVWEAVFEGLRERANETT